MTPLPLQFGQAPSEFALNSAGLTPFALANAVRIGSSSPVYVAGLLRREPLIGAWSIETTPASFGIEPWISELLPEPATPVTTHSTPSGMSTLTSRRLCWVALRISRVPTGVRVFGLSAARYAEVASGERVAGPQAFDRPLEAHRSTVGARAGAEVDHVVGDLDHLRLVLDHQHRVALVAQPPQQLVRPLDVMGMQARGGLVEDVGDVGERRPEVADHLDALRLAARERARRPVEREVAEPDLDERIEGLPQGGEQRRHRRLVEAADPIGQVADLHRAGVRDVDPPDPRRPGRLGQAGAAAVGTGGEGDRPVHERPDVRLQRLHVLGQERLLDPRHQPLVGHVDALDLHPDRLPVEEVVALLLGVVADRLVRVDEAGRRVEAVVPAARVVARDGQRALGERLVLVEELGEVDVGHAAHALAARAHAADDGVGLPLGLAIAALDGDRAGPADRGDVEGERLGRPDVRLPEPAEEDAQHRVGVGGGADGGAGVAAHPLLVDDDRGREAVEDVDVGPRQRGHEALHEGAVGLVDEPLRLGGDGGEDQRALAGARDAGEDGQPALRDLDARRSSGCSRGRRAPGSGRGCRQRRIGPR